MMILTEKNKKYITFPREHWDAFQAGQLDHGALPYDWQSLADQEVLDAVVIRRQDVFASPALDAYANGILVAIEAIKHATGGIQNDIIDRQLANLQEKADYFHEQAQLAAHADKKLPD